MNQRLDHIDIAKGIAIILVVYGHAAAQLQGSTVYQEYLAASNVIIFSFVMPIFFIISGAFQRIRLDSETFNAKIYLSKIIKSILLPFYSLSLVFMMIKLVLDNDINTPSAIDMICGMLFQQSNGELLPSGVLWFLFTLFMFHIITYSYLKLLNYKIIYLVIAAIILRSKFNILDHLHYMAYDKISTFFIFYLFGYCFYDKIVYQPIHRVTTLFVLTLVYILIRLMHNNSNLMLYISPFGLSGITLSLVVLGISYWLSQNFNKSFFVRILKYYGKHSIVVYVFHMPTFTIFKTISSLMNIEPNYSKQLILFLPGIILPLCYKKIISYNKIIYEILLGRKP